MGRQKNRQRPETRPLNGPKGPEAYTLRLHAPVSHSSRTPVIAGYIRFSTDGQDPITLELQKAVINPFAESLGGVIRREHWFSDVAESGAFVAPRDGLQALLAACEAGEIDIVLLYKYDRLARDAFLGSDFARVFERRGIVLYSARDRQLHSKFDQIHHAMHAEHERKQIADRSRDGLDALVARGGMPQGAMFGYDPSIDSAFPVINDGEAKIIRQMFSLVAAGWTVRRLRKWLIADKKLDPSGKLNWSKSTIYQILRREQYTGKILFRLFHAHKDETGRRCRRERQPSENVQDGFNERFKIIEHELFVRVQDVMAARRSGPKGGTLRPHEPALFGCVTCDCPNSDGQEFGRITTGQGAYRCRRGDDCAHPLTEIQGVVVESAVLRVVTDCIEGAAGSADFVGRLKQKISTHRAALQAEHEELQARCEAQIAVVRRLFSSAVAEGWDADVVTAMRDDEQTKLNDIRQALSALPKVPPNPDISGLRTLADGLRSIDEFPLRTGTGAEALLAAALRRVVPKVVLKRWGLPGNRISVEVHMDLAAAAYDSSSKSELTIVSSDLEMSITMQAKMDKGVAEHVAEQGKYALTDDQWARIRGRLPEAIHEAVGGIEPRTLAHAINFRLHAIRPMTNLPTFFGDPTAVFNGIQRFVYRGGLEIMIDELGGEDQEWAKDLDLISFSRMRRAVPHAVPAVASGERGAILPLTDFQWEVARRQLSQNVEHPHGCVQPQIDARELLDAVIYCLRSGCPWPQMPTFSSTKKDMLRGLARLSYSGSWNRVVAAWGERCPNVLVGLKVDGMLKTGRGAPVASKSRHERGGERGEVTEIDVSGTEVDLAEDLIGGPDQTVFELLETQNAAGLLAAEGRRPAHTLAAMEGRIFSIINYGYEADPEAPDHLRIEGKSAEVVREIFAMRREGMTFDAIAQSLNSRGIPSSRGKQWSAAVIYGMIGNPIYAGILAYRRTEREWDAQKGRWFARAVPRKDWALAYYPELAIVDRDTYEATQRKTRRKSRVKRVHYEPVRRTKQSLFDL